MSFHQIFIFIPIQFIQEGNGNETTTSQPSSADTSTDPSSVHFGRPTPLSWRYPDDEESFKNGYNECKSEALHFLVNSGGIQPESPICTRLVDYLKGYLDHRGKIFCKHFSECVFFIVIHIR